MLAEGRDWALRLVSNGLHRQPVPHGLQHPEHLIYHNIHIHLRTAEATTDIDFVFLPVNVIGLL